MVNNAPITEFFDDEATSLNMFFSNGKKEFWKFDEVKKLGIDKCLFFFPRHFENLKGIKRKCKLVYEFMSASTISPVYLYDKKVLIALCPLGGAAATNLMEELIFVGIKHFVGTGSCGAIQNIDLDQFFVPYRAIRDEGTSYHYLPPKRFVGTSSNIDAALEKALRKHEKNYTVGVVWTTDAIYRETQKRIFARLKDGAIGVDMETASLAAVAEQKKVDYGCLLYFSDYNNGSLWKSRFYDKIKLRNDVINIAVDALLSLDEPSQNI